METEANRTWFVDKQINIYYKHTEFLCQVHLYNLERQGVTCSLAKLFKIRRIERLEQMAKGLDVSISGRKINW